MYCIVLYTPTTDKLYLQLPTVTSSTDSARNTPGFSTEVQLSAVMASELKKNLDVSAEKCASRSTQSNMQKIYRLKRNDAIKFI